MWLDEGVHVVAQEPDAGPVPPNIVLYSSYTFEEIEN